MRFLLAAGVAASVAMSVIGGSHPASAATTSPANWTQWGFNAQHSGYNPSETVLTRANVGHLVSAFSTRVNGVYADPIVAGGVVYLSDNYDVAAIDGATGAVEWRTGICGEDTSDPAFAQGRVWVELDDPGVAAISTGGKKVMCLFSGVSLGIEPPSAGDGTVYAEDDESDLAAINAATGAVRWSIGLPDDQGPYSDSVDSPSLTSDGSAVFASGSNNTEAVIYKVNAATGAVIWSQAIDTCGASAVAVSGSMLYVTGCGVYGLSAATGSIVWHETALTGDVSAPAVAGGLVFAAGAGATNGVAAFNATNGSLVWDDPEYQGDAPTIANGVVYVDDDDYTVLGIANENALNKLVMLNSSTGALLGTLSPPSSAAAFVGAVIPVDGRVYVCTENANYGVSLHGYVP